MDLRTWAVAVVFGLLVGLGSGRFRQEQRAMLATLALSSVIGVVTWIVTPESVAGPSLAVGCGLGFLAMLLTRR